MNQLNQPLFADKAIASLPKGELGQDSDEHLPSLPSTSLNATLKIDQEKSWQHRLLPFMLGTIFLFSTFFFVATTWQMWGLYTQMTPIPFPIENSELTQGEQQFFSDSPQSLQLLEYFQWKSSYLLEKQTIQQRYRQANLSLLSRLWIKYAGFVTGMILAIVGSVFIVGKLQEPRSTLEGSSPGWALSFNTASPGLVLCLLGTVLMVTTHIVHQKIETYDVAVYTNSEGSEPTPHFDWNTGSQEPQTSEEIRQNIHAILTDKEIEPRHAESIRKALEKAEGSPTTQNLVMP